MKKIFYLFAISLTLFVSCDPMDDIYEDLNEEQTGIVADEVYTLTEDDYEELGVEYTNLDSEEQAKELLPGFLADRYLYWGDGSSVLVNYNLYLGSAEGVSVYTNANVYELSQSDYALTGSDANGFYPDASVNEGIVSVLDSEIENPEEGDILLVEYNQYTEVPSIGYAPIISYDFANSLEGFTTVNFLGPQEWTAQANYVEGNGYDSGQVANVDWLISPVIDLTEESDVRFQISQAINYAGDLSLLKILVSTDFNGSYTESDVDLATWDEINLTTSPEGNSNDFILSEDYDFSAYEGQEVYLALKYESTSSDAARWRVESIELKTQGITGEYDGKGAYFVYDGSSWETAENVYYLSDSDYDSMGAPGQYNNFSNSAPADNYIPVFLEENYPYAQEEDEMIVVYKYYSSSSGETETRGNLYTFTDGSWEAFQTVTEASLQFGLENGVWVPDNTIRYLLTASDYNLIVEELGDEAGYEGAVASMSTYSNFDRRDGNPAYWSDEMIYTALAIVLDNIDPDAEEEQKYQVTLDIYNGTNTTESFTLIKENGEWVPFEG